MKTNYKSETSGTVTKESAETKLTLFKAKEFNCQFLCVDVTHKSESGYESSDEAMIPVKNKKDIDKLIEKLEKIKAKL